jgi:ribokinase
MLNAAPAVPLADAELADVDVLVVNDHEAAALLGEPIPAASSDDALSLARRLQRRVPLAVVTLGARGAVLAAASGAVHEPSFAVAPVDTTGAGDAFVGALAVALVEDQAPREALRFANAAGALAATRHGAQPSMPTRAEVARLWRATRESAESSG